MVPVWMTFSDIFKVMIIQCQITWKWYNIQLHLEWSTNRKSYMIYQTAPFSMTLNVYHPQFQGYAILWSWISQTRTTSRHSVIEILIGTYTRPTQQCHFEWPLVTSSDLAKYSMTRSLARSLCDSWASAIACHSVAFSQGRFYVGAGGAQPPPKCWPGPPNILVPTAKIRILKI